MRFRIGDLATPMGGMEDTTTTVAPSSPLTVCVGGSIHRVLACGDATVGELAAAVGLDPRRPLWVDGRPVRAGDTLERCALTTGSAIEDRGPPRPDGGSDDSEGNRLAPSLRCVAGPASGGAHPLGPGHHVIGRACDASICIDDPGLDPYAALVDVAASGEITFTQLAGRVPATVDGEHVAGPSPLADGSSIELGTSRLRLRCERSEGRLGGAGPSSAGAVLTPAASPWQRVLHRSQRVRPSRWLTPVTPPPAAEEPPSTSEGPSLGWLSSGIALAGGIVIAVAMRSVLFLLFALVGVVGAMTVAGARWVLRRRRQGKKRRARQQASADLESALERQRVEFVERHRATLPSVDELVDVAGERGEALWQRRPDHDDAFLVALGWGPLEWTPVFTDDQPGRSGVTARPLDRQRVIPDLLAPFRLGHEAAVAVRGDGRPLTRSVLVQLAVTMGPADWEVLLVVDRPGDWAWVDWLPHAGDVPTERRVDAGDERAIADVLARLDAGDERLLLVVTDRPDVLSARTGPLRRYLGGRRSSALWVLVDDGAAVPSVCTSVVQLGSRSRARWTPDATVASPFLPIHVVGVTTDVATAVARRLAPLVDPEAPESACDAVPRHVRLTDVLAVGNAPPAMARAIERWWSESTSQSLCAPLGVGDGVVSVDLVVDGPHALVAGTTGSGKSELLRTLVAGLAARHPPERLRFVLVDYKGGSTFDACALLPHTAGVVTDLDGELGARVLASLQAELRWRERRLRDAGATDLEGYSAAVEGDAIARLVVVIDEFAALAVELPELLHGLVGVAQRGRSLGVHLVLATQRPAGVVSDEIRANTDLRLALRVQDAADARDVVGDDRAAGFPAGIPGRCALRLGGEHITFQAACASDALRVPGPARVLADRGAAPVPGDGDWGDGSGAGMPGPTELEAIVVAVCDVADRAAAVPRHRPWLEPLPTVLPADGFDGDAVDADAVGLLDVPAEQRRAQLRWAPEEEGNLAIYGSRGAGTTSTLITLVDVLCRRQSPDELHVYVVDTGGEPRLVDLARLPHCGALVRIGEDERLARLVGRLHGELERRRASPGAGPRPQLLWCVDGFGALRESCASALDGRAEQLAALLAEGPSLGISALLVVHPGRSAATAVSGCARRWLFHLDDPVDASAVGAPARQVPGVVPGRVLDLTTGHAGQIVVPRALMATAAGDGADRSGWAPPIRVLPADVDAASLGLGSSLDPVSDEARLVLGLGYDDLAPAVLAVRPGEHVVVTGAPGSGRSTAARRLVEAWRTCYPEGRVTVVCPDLRSPLAVLDIDMDATDGCDRGGAQLVVVDDADRDDERHAHVAEMLRSAAPGVCVVAVLRQGALRGEYEHWTRLVRRSRLGLVLTSGGEPDGEVLGEPLPRRLPVPARPGLGYLVQSGRVTLVQVARGDGGDSCE